MMVKPIIPWIMDAVASWQVGKRASGEVGKLFKWTVLCSYAGAGLCIEIVGSEGPANELGLKGGENASESRPEDYARFLPVHSLLYDSEGPHDVFGYLGGWRRVYDLLIAKTAGGRESTSLFI